MTDSNGSPTISIVTIALNAARELPLTLESVIGQRYPSLELIVIDGMSWDDSASVIKRYRDQIDIAETIEDNGIYFAMNAASDLANGEYILFLNAGDTFYDKDAVSRAVAALGDEPDIFYGNHIYVENRLEIFRRSADFDLLACRLASGTMGPGWADQIPCHQATFTRTTLLRNLRYDTQLRIGADHELLFRAHAAGARFQYVDEIIAHYHGGGFSQAMGMRTTLENVSTYRRYSDMPAAVDARFLANGTPFRAETARTGFVLGGLLPVAGDDHGGARVGDRGVRLQSGHGQSWGLELSGSSAVADQGIAILADGEQLAWLGLRPGSFRASVRFDRIVPPATKLTIRPDRLADDGGGPGISIRRFRFLTLDTKEYVAARPGDVIPFIAARQTDLDDVLGNGWAALEQTHLWSTGLSSDLWLRIGRDVQSLSIDMSGNPHVEDRRQDVCVILNGTPVADSTMMHGERRTLQIARASSWLSDQPNHLVFEPARVATPPADTGDTRLLGICLWRIAFF